MELTVAKKDLLKVVARMQGVAERKSTMPVLANVLLVAESPNTLRMAATDLYLGLAAKVPASVVVGGSIAVSARDLFERIKMMPDGPISIIAHDNANTVVRASGSARRYSLRTMPGSDFPTLPSPAEGAPSLAVNVTAFSELIEKTHFSISTDESRPHLNSALFEWEGDTLRMVTTDGHRLSKAESTISGRQATAAMLIPLKAIHELRRLCEELGAEPVAGLVDESSSRREIRITQSGPNAFFQGAGMTLSVKLVDAQFPPYGQVIPKSADKVVRMARAPFADALKAVSIAASERTGGVRLSLVEGSVRISSESAESGDGFDEVPVEYTGPNMSIGFNAKYFLDVLGAMSDDEVELKLSGELDPAIVQPAHVTPICEQRYLAVVMPMRI